MHAVQTSFISVQIDRHLAPPVGVSLGLKYILKETNRNIQGNSFHIHFVNNENKGFIPVRVQVATLHACLLLLPNPLLLGVKQLQLNIWIRCSSNIHLLQLASLQNSH